MNNDTKWERVDHDNLTAGENVRVRPAGGKTWLEGIVEYIGSFDVARVALEGTATIVHTDTRWDVERAVPERTLPTGYYLDDSDPARGLFHVYADGAVVESIGGEWRKSRIDAISEDAVRLVPVTEVEEAEKRARIAAIREIHALLDRNPSSAYSAAVMVAKAYAEAVRDV